MINTRTTLVYCISTIVLVTLSGTVHGAEENELSVSVSSRRVMPGTYVRVEVHCRSERGGAGAPQAVVMKPAEGVENLQLLPSPGKTCTYGGIFRVKETGP